MIRTGFVRYCLAGAAGLVALLLTLAASVHPAVSADAAPTIHEGVASCAGSSCHGRLAPSGAVVMQNELFSWQDDSSPAGEHSRAYKILTEPRAREIAQRLGLGAAERAAECLGCHADPVAADQRGAKFQVADGVGCESCHGGSRSWLAGHFVVGASHAGNVANGLRALDNPRVRAEVCLDCHLGSDQPGQFVSHAMMAAGHPRLSFELDLFSTMQAHYRVDADYAARKRVVPPAQVWAIGQASAVERVLSLYSDPRLGQDGAFPQLVFFDCHSCHRRISDEPDARPQALSNPFRPIPVGTPVFNDESIIMLSVSARQASPQLAARFEIQSRDFHTALTRDRESALTAGAALSATAGQLADALAATTFSRAQTFDMLDDVLGGALERYTDYSGSAQAVMATDTLLASLSSNGQVSAANVRALRPDLDRAYAAVRDPNSFDPRSFRTTLTRVADGVRRLK